MSMIEYKKMDALRESQTSSMLTLLNKQSYENGRQSVLYDDPYIDSRSILQHNRSNKSVRIQESITSVPGTAQKKQESEPINDSVNLNSLFMLDERKINT